MPFLLFMALFFLIGGFALILTWSLDAMIAGICFMFLGYIILRLHRLVRHVERRNDTDF